MFHLGPYDIHAFDCAGVNTKGFLDPSRRLFDKIVEVTFSQEEKNGVLTLSAIQDPAQIPSDATPTMFTFRNDALDDLLNCLSDTAGKAMRPIKAALGDKIPWRNLPFFENIRFGQGWKEILKTYTDYNELKKSILAKRREMKASIDELIRDSQGDNKTEIIKYLIKLSNAVDLHFEILLNDLDNKLKLQEHRNTPIKINYKQIDEIEFDIRRDALLELSTLLVGETGTGKEYYARTIHMFSNRKDKPFVPVNCSSLPEERLESELFGHKKGAFTGAIENHDGLIKCAEPGTIFLDELGSLPDKCWAKLLRFLQEKELRPVGSTKPQKANVRIIAATMDKKSIPLEIKNRFDCFHHLPPLRERVSQIPDLAHDFFIKAKTKYNKISLRFPEVERETLAHAEFNWPGNVRQLEKAIDMAVRNHKGDRDLLEGEILRAAVELSASF